MNRADILAEAARLTADERQSVYGDPFTNHERIARLWSVYLGHEITAAQAAMCMALVKVARLMQTPDHLDSFIDLAAYAAIAGEIETCAASATSSPATTTATPNSSMSLSATALAFPS